MSTAAVGSEARTIGVATSLFFGLTALYANAAPQRESTPREPQMVNLNVGSKARPITDLKRDDFQVIDNGNLQTIAFFRHRDTTLDVVSKLARNEYSNRRGSNVPRSTNSV